MTREEMDFIGGMNMCDEISNEAYKKIMCHCEELEPCEDCISREEAEAIFKNARKSLYELSRKERVKDFQTREMMLLNAEQFIHLLPSVTPKFTDAEIQKMQELEQAQLDKAYELGKAEMQPCEDCISRTELLSRIDAERKHLLDLKMDGAEHILVHHARRIIEDMPTVTPKGVTITDFADRCRECGRIRACDDCISRKDVIAIIEWAYDECKIDGYTDYCEIRDMVKELPSVTPKESKD